MPGACPTPHATLADVRLGHGGRQGVLKIQVHTFLNALTLPPLEIGIDEKSLESLQTYNRGARSPQMAIDWLRNQYLVPGEVESRAFVGGNLQGASGAFAFHGLHTRASVRRVTTADGADVMVLDKIARTKNHNDSPVTLVHADVRFVDATVAGRIQAEALGQLNDLANSGSSFLEVWNRYGAIENEAALRRARQAGSLAYDHFEPLADGRFKFFLSTETDPDDSDRFKKAISGEGGTSIEALPATCPKFCAARCPGRNTNKCRAEGDWGVGIRREDRIEPQGANSCSLAVGQ